MAGPLHNALCPQCNQRAPIVLRGASAVCTACGAKRMPFTANTVNLAGKGQRIGGAAAKFFGWASVVGGVSFAAFVTLVLQSIYPEGYLGYAFAVPALIISLAIGIPLLLGGRRLQRGGDEKAKSARLEAVRSMAAHRQGALTARVVADTLRVPEPDAEELLTELAKDPEENVSLDIDPDGRIYYLFGLEGEELAAARWRIEHPISRPKPRPKPPPLRKRRVQNASAGSATALESR